MHFTLSITVDVTERLADLLRLGLGVVPPQAAAPIKRTTVAAHEVLSDEPPLQADRYEKVDLTPEPGAPAKRSRKKAETEPAAPSADEPSSTPPDGPVSDDPFAAKASTSAGAAALGVGDPFSAAIRQVNAEPEEQAHATAAEDDAPAYTISDVNDAAAAAMNKVKASGVKKIMAEDLKLLDKEGQPVSRLADVQAADYGVLIDALKAAAR